MHTRFFTTASLQKSLIDKKTALLAKLIGYDFIQKGKITNLPKGVAGELKTAIEEYVTGELAHPLQDKLKNNNQIEIKIENDKDDKFCLVIEDKGLAETVFELQKSILKGPAP